MGGGAGPSLTHTHPSAQHREKIILLVEMTLAGNESLPCFVGGKAAVIAQLRQRFNPQMTVGAHCHCHHARAHA